MTQFNDEYFMAEALRLAHMAGSLGEVPVGAVVVVQGHIVGRGFNRRELLQSCLEHAEIQALQQASAAQGRWRLSDATVYSTLEPCIMCAGALSHARIKNLIYGAFDPKFGAIDSLYGVGRDTRLNHQFHSISGVLAQESAELLKTFFKGLRSKHLPSR